VKGWDGSTARRGTTTAALLAASLLLLAGCGVPVPPEIPATPPGQDAASSGAPAVDRLVPRDDLTRPLTLQLERITARIALIRTALDGAEPEPAAREAVGLLLGPAGGGTAPGLLPAITPDRADTGSDDLTTGLIALAGETGGERGRLVLELVRDPMLGDLGAWQRDPVGIITLLRSIVEQAGDTAELDTLLLELPGELTRALGYVLAVVATDDPLLATHATRQAQGRLGVVLVAIELATETLVRGATDAGPDTQGDGS
jgi:hypothetical protein